jgi:hypothetical protein
MKTNTVTGHSQVNHKKLFAIIGSLCLILIVMPMLLLGWLGFVPGLSSVMGASNPRDLGVRYSNADYTAYKQKVGVQFKKYSDAPTNPYNKNQKILLTKPKTVKNIDLTQEELTAAVNSIGWDWLPMQKIQVKLDNGTIELSGKLDSSRLEKFRKYMNDNNKNNSDINGAISWAKRFSNNAPFYIKATSSTDNNVVKFQLIQAQIGRMNIPLGRIDKSLKQQTSTKFYTDNFKAKSAKIKSGKIEFTGTYPSVIYIK